MEKLKQYFVYALAAGFLLSPLGCSGPLRGLSPEVKEATKPYQRTLKRIAKHSDALRRSPKDLALEEKGELGWHMMTSGSKIVTSVLENPYSDFVKGFDEVIASGLKISEEEHKQNLEKVISICKEWNKTRASYPVTRCVYLLKDEKDFEWFNEIKKFDSEEDVRYFFKHIDEYIDIFLDENTNKLTINCKETNYCGDEIKFTIRDENCNGIRLGEEDSIYRKNEALPGWSGRQALYFDSDLDKVDVNPYQTIMYDIFTSYHKIIIDKIANSEWEYQKIDLAKKLDEKIIQKYTERYKDYLEYLETKKK